MPHITCHRKNYKVLDPHVWQVIDSTAKHLGYYNGITKTSCDPPRYVLTSETPENVVLPPGSAIIDQKKYNSTFPAHLEGPEVFEIRNTREQTIFDLEQEAREYRIQLGEKDVKIAQLNHKLKHTVAGGSIRWKLTYTWCDNVTEVYWDFRTKKQAVAFMESNIKGFFGIKVVESIRNVKYDKYIYGIHNVEQ